MDERTQEILDAVELATSVEAVEIEDWMENLRPRFRKMAIGIIRTGLSVKQFGYESLLLSRCLVKAAFRVTLGLFGGSVLLTVIALGVVAFAAAYSGISFLVRAVVNALSL